MSKDKKLIEAQQSVEELKSTMQTNITLAIERGEHLDDLLDKSNQLSEHSIMFKNQAGNLKWQMCKRNLCYGAIITGFILFLIMIIILLIQPWKN